MWFGTLGGLNKYDGHHFTVYTHTPFDSTTLSDNAVFCLAEGRDGMLWIGTGNGLNRFDPSTGTFTAYYRRATQPASLVPAAASQRNPQDTELNQPGTESSQ